MRPDDAEAKAQQERLARFNKTPRLMTGQNFGNEDLSGLSISNSSISKAVFSGCFALNAGIHKILFKDCTFTDTDFTRANIREVIFENCSFENTRFDESVFFNVSFINCSFKGNQRENGLSKARIALSRLYNVTFENATLENFLLFQDSGRTYFKSTDLTGLSIRANGSNAFYPRLDVSPVQFDLRLENCTGGDFELDVNNVPSELRINKASFDNAKINYFTRIQITDSSIGGLGYIEAKEWLVVKNSTLCADLGAYGGMYLIGNTYVSERSASKVNAFLDAPEGMYRTTKLRPKNGSLCVVEGGAPGAWLTVFGGNLYISGLEMDLAFFDVDNNTREKIALNLKDVSIRSGHLYSMPDETYWENVNIRETMTARQTRDRNPKEIQAVNVTMPEGKPWLDGDAFIIIPAEKKDWVKYEVPFMRFQGNH